VTRVRECGNAWIPLEAVLTGDPEKPSDAR
jgi:hypothetical protein